MKITVTHDDGTTADITEGVQVAYDIAHQSMDWSSGFLSSEEMQQIADMAAACRFDSFADLLDDIKEARARDEREQAILRRAAAEGERIMADRQARIDTYFGGTS